MTITEYGMTVGLLLSLICIVSLAYAILSYRSYRLKPDSIKLALIFIYVGSFFVFSGGTSAFLLKLLASFDLNRVVHTGMYGLGVLLMLSALSYTGLFMPKLRYRKILWAVTILGSVVFTTLIMSLNENMVVFEDIRGYDDLILSITSAITLLVIMLITLGEQIGLLVMVGMRAENHLARLRARGIALGTFVAGTAMAIMIMGPGLVLITLAYIVYIIGLSIFYLGFNPPSFLKTN